jgi:ribosomal protein S18 acetylase RimI-like enzyme
MALERGGRDLAGEAIATLADWAPRWGCVTSLHAGDVGWHLRLDDANLDETIVVVRDRAEVVAVALVESSGLRPTLRPDRWDDNDLAVTLGTLAASLAESLGDHAMAYCDVPPQSALRAWLIAHGWELDPDPWAAMYRPLAAVDAALGVALAESVATDGDVADRVDVQFSAFEHSTFTVQRWHQMAAGPGFRRDLDLLRRDADGVPVAGATAWTAGPGRVGILEPVGTHRDHVRQGHGRAVVLAAIGALARAGASGVSVQTPLSNDTAIHAYVRAGLQVVDHLRGLRYPSPDS